jgi:hypothetical protein
LWTGKSIGAIAITRSEGIFKRNFEPTEKFVPSPFFICLCQSWRLRLVGSYAKVSAYAKVGVGANCSEGAKLAKFSISTFVFRHSGQKNGNPKKTDRTISAAAGRALLGRLLLRVEPVVVVAVLVVQNAVPAEQAAALKFVRKCIVRLRFVRLIVVSVHFVSHAEQASALKFVRKCPTTFCPKFF